MSVLTEAHDAIAKGFDAVKGWVADVEGHLPKVAELAAKYEASPIVQALEGAVLPPTVEQAIANLITEAASVHAEHGDVTVTASATPPAAGAQTDAPAESAPTEAAPEAPTAPAA